MVLDEGILEEVVQYVLPLVVGMVCIESKQLHQQALHGEVWSLDIMHC